jgi:hypothetical protein
MIISTPETLITITPESPITIIGIRTRAVNAAWPPRKPDELFRANTDSRNRS